MVLIVLLFFSLFFLSLPFSALPLYLLLIEGDKQAFQKKHLNLLRFLFLPFAIYYLALLLFFLMLAANLSSDHFKHWAGICLTAPIVLGPYAAIYAVIVTVIKKIYNKPAPD